ncbi:cellulase family glycosylhydrolase [Nocardioides humi]|uniref:cellulase family glycosylhydrolase n=1 Tax=Nocardioides humi TaxID=449461 RepID=UPI0011282A37|nr:cellulase family glycosylhydrolase [Nocardioides humi]
MAPGAALPWQLDARSQSGVGHRPATGQESPRPSATPSTDPSAAPSNDAEPRRGDDALGFQLSAHHRADARRALKVMDRLSASGARWVRVDVGWATLQPNGPGPFDPWYAGLIDDVLAGARASNLQVIVSFWLTPPWASTTGSLYAPPANPQDYANALGRAAQRWHDDVAAWEVWNEPNFDGFLTGADPVTYTRMLCAAYPAVKEHDDSPVLFGGLMYNDDAWLGKAYRAGAKDCFDVLATHPYVGPSDAAPDTPSVGAVWRLTHTPAMRAVMDEWGDRHKKIWITELGWSTGTDSEGNAWDRPVTPRKQARYLSDAVRLIRESYAYVGPIIWYRDIDGPTASYQDGFGLLGPDLTAKPALRAFEAEVQGR